MSGKGRTIHSKERNVVHKVLDFFEKEAACEKLCIPIQQAQKRTAAATGVSMRTVTRIKQEANISPILSTPGKRRRPNQKRNVLLSVDDFDLCVIRQTVNEFYANNKIPSLTTLLPVIKEKIDFPWKKETLRKLLHKIGFRWKRSPDKRTVAMERPDIVQWRFRYLRDIKKFRKENRLIIYLDESWIDSNLCFGKCWQAGKIRALTKKSAGNRLIIVHAGSQDGFIKGASLVFKSGTTSGDYHGQMNFDNFSKWLKEKLLPNIPPNSVICMDNAPYHTKVLNPKPSKYATKKQLSEWLEKKQIPHNLQMRKTELFELVDANAPPTKKYCIDELLKEKGHDVLRIPPYHCDLNAIELAWAATKRYVRERNVSAELNLTTMKTLTTEALDTISKEQWVKYTEHVIKIEKEYWELDNLVEETIEEINFMVGTGSSDDESESTATAESDFEDWKSDSSLSGVEML